MYTAECIHCGGTVGEAFTQLGDGEEALLRDHLNACTGAITARYTLNVGDLLTQFRLTRVDSDGT